MRNALVIVSLLLAVSGLAATPAVTWFNADGQVMASADGARKPLRFAVLAEGFSAGDIAGGKFQTSLKGLFDAFKQNTGGKLWLLGDAKSDFAFCAVSLVSNASGVAEDTGSPVVANSVLGTVINFDPDTCWMRSDPSRDAAAIQYAQVNCGNPNRVVVVLNFTDPEIGGCTSRSMIYMARDVDGGIVYHELGHSLIGLDDEYKSPPGGLDSLTVASKNCSAVDDSAKVPWKAELTQPLTRDATGASQDVVGIFEGCDAHETGVYRGSIDCAMNTMSRDFCGVCKPAVDSCLQRFRDEVAEEPSGEQTTFIFQARPGREPWLIESFQSKHRFRAPACDAANWRLDVTDGFGGGTISEMAATSTWVAFAKSVALPMLRREHRAAAMPSVVAISAPTIRVMEWQNIPNIKVQILPRPEAENDKGFASIDLSHLRSVMQIVVSPP